MKKGRKNIHPKGLHQRSSVGRRVRTAKGVASGYKGVATASACGLFKSKFDNGSSIDKVAIRRVGARPRFPASKAPKTLGSLTLEGDQAFLKDAEGQLYALEPNLAILILPGELASFEGSAVSAKEKKGARVLRLLGFQQRPRKVQGNLVSKKNRIFFHCDGAFANQLFDWAGSPPENPPQPLWVEILTYPTTNEKGQVHWVDESFESQPAAGASLESELNALLDDFRIEKRFPKPLLQELGHQLTTADALDSSPERVDLRSLPFITIDGEQARDFDDAIYLEETPSGYDLYVAIADVAHYVTEKTLVDNWALEKGFSLYLPGEVLPMLPFALSNELCSLKPYEDRLTLTCQISYDHQCKRIKRKIYPSRINSKARFTYEQIEAGLKRNGPESFLWELEGFSDPAFLERLNLYLQVAEKLALKRRQQGAIDFDFAESEIELSADKQVQSINKKLPSPAHKLIEQFMLEANIAVASFCREKGVPIYYRNHHSPNKLKISNLEKALAALGMGRIKLNRAQAFQGLFQKAADQPYADYVKKLALRSMAKADYGVQPEGHFGLGAETYAHFTSPIRRYADLFLHRNLKKFWRGEKLARTTARAAKHISEQERLFAKIEQVAFKLYAAEFLRAKEGKLYQATIAQTMGPGFLIQLQEPYLEGYAQMPHKNTSRKRSLRPSPSSQNYIGKAIEVSFQGFNYDAQGLDFVFVRWLAED